jgi:hypothetical protein
MRRSHWVGFAIAVCVSWVLRHELSHVFKAVGL